MCILQGCAYRAGEPLIDTRGADDLLWKFHSMLIQGAPALIRRYVETSQARRTGYERGGSVWLLAAVGPWLGQLTEWHW